jgi:hypothetical protein
MHLCPALVSAVTWEDHMRGESGQPWMRTHVRPLGERDVGSVTTAGSTRGGDRSFIVFSGAALLTTRKKRVDTDATRRAQGMRRRAGDWNTGASNTGAPRTPAGIQVPPVRPGRSTHALVVTGPR